MKKSERKAYQMLEFVDYFKETPDSKVERRSKKILISFIERDGEWRTYRRNFKILSEKGDNDFLEIKIEPNNFLIKFLNPHSIHIKTYIDVFSGWTRFFINETLYEIDGYSEDDVKLIFELED